MNLLTALYALLECYIMILRHSLEVYLNIRMTHQIADINCDEKNDNLVARSQYIN